MSSKRYSDPPLSRGSRSTRSHDSVWDSGIGSLSSEQASSGGRPDRRFTNLDFQTQLNDPYALQEALGRARESSKYWEDKTVSYKQQLTSARKAEREAEAHRKAQCDRIEHLEQELSSFNKQLREVQAERDSWRDRCVELEASLNSINPMMPASTLPIRTKADHEQDDQRVRLKTRMSPKDEARPKSSTRKSGRDRSRAPSTKRNAYIEESPTSRTHSSRASTSEPHRASRTSQPISPSIYAAAEIDGNYQPYPLPSEPRGRRR